MLVQNSGLKSQKLNVGGLSFTSDENGVFDVPDVVGQKLLTLRGYRKPRDTVEKRQAYAAFKAAEEMFRKYEGIYLRAKAELEVARVQAERNEGTPVDEEDAAEDAAQKAALAEAVVPRPTRQPSRQPKTETDEPAQDAQVTVSGLLGKYKTAPNMKWALPDLISYALALGIEAETAWSKTQVLQEIEARQDPD